MLHFNSVLEILELDIENTIYSILSQISIPAGSFWFIKLPQALYEQRYFGIELHRVQLNRRRTL